MRGGTVDKLLRRCSLLPVPRNVSDVPSGEDACRRVDVSLDVVAQPPRKELHHLAAEVFLRLGVRVRTTIEKPDHRRVLRHGNEQIAALAERRVTKQLGMSQTR